jgi:hypothetical protein
MNIKKQMLKTVSLFVLAGVSMMAASCFAPIGFERVVDEAVGSPVNPPVNPPPVSPKRVSWYVSDAVDSDMPSAVAEWGGDTVQAALSDIRSKSGKVTGGRKAVIVISGTVTAVTEGAAGATMFTISGSYPPLVFRGDAANKGIIDGGNSKRILMIKSRSSGIPNEVTLADDLTLQNGRAVSATPEDTVGGAVCVTGGVFNMTGGAIKDSVSTSGGAVATQNWGMDSVPRNLVNLSGGEITGCRNDKLVSGLENQGAAVYVIDGNLAISGTINIHGNGTDGNTLKGGAVYLTRSTIGTELTMGGGTIQGNAAGEGGGVYVGLKCVFTISNGTIAGNTASSQGGGVYVYKNQGTPSLSATFNRNGGTVRGNTPNDLNP